MYRTRALSDLELDAIDLYCYFPNKSVEVIAKELQCPSWYIQNCIFKYLNGQIKNGKYYLDKPIRTKNQPRKSLSPSRITLQLAIEETKQSNIKLRTIIKDTNED